MPEPDVVMFEMYLLAMPQYYIQTLHRQVRFKLQIRFTLTYLMSFRDVLCIRLEDALPPLLCVLFGES